MLCMPICIWAFRSLRLFFSNSCKSSRCINFSYPLKAFWHVVMLDLIVTVLMLSAAFPCRNSQYCAAHCVLASKSCKFSEKFDLQLGDLLMCQKKIFGKGKTQHTAGVTVHCMLHFLSTLIWSLLLSFTWHQNLKFHIWGNIVLKWSWSWQDEQDIEPTGSGFT